MLLLQSLHSLEIGKLKKMIDATIEMELFNDVHRVESWDNLEELLINGCNKEALEFVKMEKDILLSLMKD